VLVSTLQLAQAYAAIATRGKMYRPQVVKEVFNNQGKVIKDFKPELVREIKLKDEGIWDLIQEGLYKVVNDPKGTAWWRRGLGNQMAGKTGTSQVIRASSVDHHGVFVAFAPYDNPKIAVAALVEHGCAGSKAAAPVVEKVVNSYIKKYMPIEHKAYVAKEKEEYIRWRKKHDAKKRAQQQKNEEDANAEGEDG
jgi:penicillin-binding protein 2